MENARNFTQPGTPEDGLAYVTGTLVPKALGEMATSGRKLAGFCVVLCSAKPDATEQVEWVMMPVKAAGLRLSMSMFIELIAGALNERAQQMRQAGEAEEA